MSVYVKTVEKPRLSFKAQTLCTFVAIAGAVALPQLFHFIGAVSGVGTAFGETLLPMHLPVMLAGLLAGPYVGAVAGLLAPLCSFALSGMPGAAMLPFILIELCVYGLSAGLLRNVKMPVILKVVAVQIAGRLVRAAAILLSVYAFGNESVAVSVIWTSITVGLFGLCLQWILLPLLVYRAENLKSMLHDTEKAKTLLLNENHTCVLCKGAQIYSSEERGIKPLLAFISSETDLSGFCAADKIVGKAAAFLYVLLKVKEVYATVMSESAAEVLTRYSIRPIYGTLTEEIINRQGTGICPMEQTVAVISDPQAALAALKEKIKTMQMGS